ncbi:MAG: FGGY-family carbohydrate kinase [Oscillospiraceae bacterium]
MFFLSIDFGTSAVKMSVLDENCKTHCWAKEEYHYVLLPGEKIELKESDLLGAFFNAAAKLDAEKMKQVELVCYDTFSPSPVFMDKEGNLVYPNIITHMDRRSREQTRYIDETFGRDRYMNIAGIYPFTGGCSAMTFLWFQRNEPEVLKRTYRIGHLPTYIHKKLTGEWMVDLVNASMMGLYETTTQGGWSETILREFKLNRDWFGEIYNPGTVRGKLLPEIASKLGVPAGVPVTIGTNDVATAQMGAGNKSAGCMMNTAGSSEMISILTDKPAVNPGYYLRNSALPGLWQIYVITCGGFGVDWFYDQFCREMTKRDYFGYLDEALEKYLADNPITFDPYLTGDRQSLEKKTASWHGLTLEATRDQMLAALLKSMQGVIYDAVLKAEKVTKLQPVIKISGGMTTPTYLKLKEREFPGYSFEVVDDCPILGNVELAKYYMK